MLFSIDGREIILRNIAEGEIFGELAAIDGQPRSATIVALSNRVLASIRDSTLLPRRRMCIRYRLRSGPMKMGFSDGESCVPSFKTVNLGDKLRGDSSVADMAGHN